MEVVHDPEPSSSSRPRVSSIVQTLKKFQHDCKDTGGKLFIGDSAKAYACQFKKEMEGKYGAAHVKEQCRKDACRLANVTEVRANEIGESSDREHEYYGVLYVETRPSREALERKSMNVAGFTGVENFTIYQSRVAMKKGVPLVTMKHDNKAVIHDDAEKKYYPSKDLFARGGGATFVQFFNSPVSCDVIAKPTDGYQTFQKAKRDPNNDVIHSAYTRCFLKGK